MSNSIFNSNNKTNYSTSSYYNQKIINNLIFSNNQLKQSENNNKLSPSVLKPPVFGTVITGKLIDRNLNKFPFTL